MKGPNPTSNWKALGTALAAMTDAERAAAWAAMTDEERAAALAAMTDAERAALLGGMSEEERLTAWSEGHPSPSPQWEERLAALRAMSAEERARELAGMTDAERAAMMAGMAAKERDAACQMLSEGMKRSTLQAVQTLALAKNPTQLHHLGSCTIASCERCEQTLRNIKGRGRHLPHKLKDAEVGGMWGRPPLDKGSPRSRAPPRENGEKRT
jgi:hypothetical protein